MSLGERIKRDKYNKQMAIRRALAEKLIKISNYLHSHQNERYLDMHEQYCLDSANARIKEAVQTLI